MNGACPGGGDAAGLIVGVLGAVDCHVRTFSEAGYRALTAPQSMFPAALTALMTIYVAVLGLRLLFGMGGARLSDAPVIGLKLGFVLALSLGWSAFQTLVFDVAMDGPLEVARIVGAPAKGQLAADPMLGLQTAHDRLTEAATAFARSAGPNPQAMLGGPARAAEELWRAAAALFISTAGILTLAEVSTGVLLAVGPIFIALFLFDATRGLFVGWLRALLAAALTPLVCWVGAEILLVVLDPWLQRLAQETAAGVLDPDTATAASSVVIVFAVAQVGLLSAGSLIAGGLNPLPGRVRREVSRQISAAPAAVASPPSRAEALARRLGDDVARDAPPPRFGYAAGRAADLRRDSPSGPPPRLGERGAAPSRRPATNLRRVR